MHTERYKPLSFVRSQVCARGGIGIAILPPRVGWVLCLHLENRCVHMGAVYVGDHTRTCGRTVLSTLTPPSSLAPSRALVRVQAAQLTAHKGARVTTAPCTCCS